ncbi:MAG: hypothetical protein K8R48_01710 [Alphaproteobacteria bacterium]|nr:hypothetical protein [Alphaproteobacteria bacterium]
MNLRNIFKFFSPKPNPVEGVGEPIAGAGDVNILICNDFYKFHDEGKTIGRHLHAMGHKIDITCLDDERDLLKYLEKVKANRKPLPSAFFLDVMGVGQKTALKVIEWFEENRPETPLPDIHFLSQDKSMAINEAMRMRESDSRIMADFVDKDELNWLEEHLSGFMHPHRSPPDSKAFREVLNARLGLSLPLDCGVS